MGTRMSDAMCRVLVVEDQPDIRGMLGELFAHEGSPFVMVENGSAMRRVLETDEVDVALIDVVLPGEETGLALAEEVASRGIPPILVTGNPGYFTAVERSGHRFLFKPYRVASLLKMIDQVLRESRCDAKKRVSGSHV